MTKIKTLVFQPALAPYNIDLFNRVNSELDLRIALLNDQVSYHRELNQDHLKSLLECDYEHIHGGFEVAGRDFRPGIFKTIRRFEPQVVVTVEFSFTTLLSLFYRTFIAKNAFASAIWTTENPRILSERRGVRSLLPFRCGCIADSMIVYTEATREAYGRRGVDKKKIFVCANHQNEKTFAAKLNAARSLVSSHIRDHHLTGKKIALSVGRLVSIKGLNRIIKSFAKAARDREDFLLVLIGDGPERETLEELAAREKVRQKVLFLGYLEGSELFVWYILSAVVILASHKETYGAVVNESLLAGVPVLCSSYAGASVLIEEGKNGYIFDPYDIDSLTHLINKVLTDAPTVDITGASCHHNLMPVSFEQSAASFVKAIEYAVYIRSKKAEKC